MRERGAPGGVSALWGAKTLQVLPQGKHGLTLSAIKGMLRESPLRFMSQHSKTETDKDSSTRLDGEGLGVQHG